MEKKKNIIQIVGILLSLLAMIYAFSGIEWSVFITQLQSIHLIYYSFTVFIIIFTIYVRAIRWKLILKPQGNFSTYPLFKGVMVGYFGNNVLPFRLGEILRAYVGGKYLGLKTMIVLPTVIAERFIDLFSFFLIFLIMSFGFQFPDWVVSTRLILFIIVIFLISVVFMYIKLAHKITGYLQTKSGRIWNLLSELHKSITSLFKLDDYLIITLLSLGLWALYGIHYYIGLVAFDIDIGLQGAAIILAASTFSVAIPSAPGFVGTYHSALIYTLILFGIDKSLALSYAVMIHLAGFIPITLLGLYYYLKSNTTLKDIQ